MKLANHIMRQATFVREGCWKEKMQPGNGPAPQQPFAMPKEKDRQNYVNLQNPMQAYQMFEGLRILEVEARRRFAVRDG